MLRFDSNTATLHDLSRTFNQSSPHPTWRFSCHQIDLVSVNFKPYPLLEQGMDGKKQFSNSGWQATQCCLGQSESQIKSWSNCHPKMVGTNHLSVEDVQIDKACVFRQKKRHFASFNHSSQIKPKYFPETKTLAYQFFDLKGIFAKINEHSHE